MSNPYLDDFDEIVIVQPTNQPCPECKGNGQLPGSTETFIRLCKRCRGKGTI